MLAPYAHDININEKVMALYLENLLPGITQPGTDNNFGSSAMYDVLALQVSRMLDVEHCRRSCMQGDCREYFLLQIASVNVTVGPTDSKAGT